MARGAERLLIPLAAALAVATAQCGLSAAIPSPPEPPRQPSAIREHLRTAHEAARADRSSATAVGAYCLALHADMYYDAADACYAIPIGLDRDDWQWTYLRAMLRSDLGEAGDLAGELRTSVGFEPGFAPAWLRLGDAEFKAGRYDEADAAWRRVLQLGEPDRPASAPVAHVVEVPAASYASLGLARLHLMRGDRAGARQILEGIVANGPPFGSAHRLLAEIFAAEGRDADEALALARARRLPPFVPYADPMMDRLALESRNSTFLLRIASEADLAVNGAWSEYLTRRALEFDPDNPEVVVKLGRVLRTIGKVEESLTHFRRYQMLVPGDHQALGHLGSALSELERYAEAEPLLRQAITALDDAQTYYNLALLLARTGRLDEAIGEYEEALERDPNHVLARSNLAVVFARKGQTGRAVQELTRVLAVDPENDLALANLRILGAIPRP